MTLSQLICAAEPEILGMPDMTQGDATRSIPWRSDGIRRWISLARPQEERAGLPPHRAEGGQVWREHGALEYRECVGDDLKVKGMVPFPKSRAHRDRVNAKVMKDPRLAKMMADPKAMPFDVKRMAYGGFKVLVDL